MKLVLATLVAAAALPAAAEITLFSNDSFDGRYISFQAGERNLNKEGFNDRASSAIVRGGQYPSLSSMGMGDAISSVRPVNANVTYEDNRYAPPPRYAYDYRKREG